MSLVSHACINTSKKNKQMIMIRQYCSNNPKPTTNNEQITTIKIIASRPNKQCKGQQAVAANEFSIYSK